jgi:hypothetical protein
MVLWHRSVVSFGASAVTKPHFLWYWWLAIWDWWIWAANSCWRRRSHGLGDGAAMGLRAVASTVASLDRGWIRCTPPLAFDSTIFVSNFHSPWLILRYINRQRPSIFQFLPSDICGPAHKIHLNLESCGISQYQETNDNDVMRAQSIVIKIDVPSTKKTLQTHRDYAPQILRSTTLQKFHTHPGDEKQKIRERHVSKSAHHHSHETNRTLTLLYKENRYSKAMSTKTMSRKKYPVPESLLQSTKSEGA